MNLINIINDYLKLYPHEEERLQPLITFINNHNEKDYTDWNNFDGHVVASGFIYAKEDNKFLVLYHNDLKMYLYPGGHIDQEDKSILDAAKREVAEETGLSNFKLLNVTDNINMPIDIDIHQIGFNERLNIPAHQHFDFRYLFVIDKITNIIPDQKEMNDYKWVSIDELNSSLNCKEAIEKIKKILII